MNFGRCCHWEMKAVFTVVTASETETLWALHHFLSEVKKNVPPHLNVAK